MTEILLKRELEPLAKQRKRFKLLIALAISWSLVAVVALLVFAVSRFLLPLSPAILLGAIGVVAAIAAFAAANRVNRLAPDYRDLARKIETTKPDLHTLLLTAVEQERDEATGRLGYLQERLIGDALGAIRQEEKLQAVPRRQMFWAGTAHAAALIILLAVLFSVPRPAPATTSVALGRMKNQVTITPGDANIERGSALVVLARFDGTVPAEAAMIVTTNGGVARRIPLAKNLNDPVFGASIPDVQGPLGYRIEYGGDHTADFKVTVFEHPRLERADAQISYPSYTELPQKRIEDTKRVSAVEGSSLDLSLQLNKAVTKAQLVGKDKSILPLTIETNKAQARLDGFHLDKSQTYELQLVDSEGRSNKLATTFVFEALTNQRPTLKFVMPRGDQRVSPLQEVFFQAEAQDDFGLKQFGLTYSVGGAEPTTLALGSNAPAHFKTNFTHLLRLEDIHAEVDQLVTYFVWADDIGPDGNLRRTSSDMYFAEVRPFEQIFREGENMESQNGQQQQRQQGRQQSQSEKLAELQKQIINATWKLQRQESATKPSEKYLENEPVILESEQQALAQAEAMDDQMQDFQMKEALQVATKHMEKAIEELTAATNSPAPLPRALASEQAAYQAMLKLQAREFQVMRSQQAQGQSQRSQQRNQAQLDQLDLKQQQNRYETQREANAAPEQDAAKKEQLEQLSKLKELAQRQQDINEKLKELQTALQEAKTEKEKEDLQRELKRLREEQRSMLADMDELKQRMDQQKGDQAQSREGQQQMEQARQEAQKASEAMEQGSVPQALAAGTRAERDLEKMRDDARKKNSSQFSEEMKQMRNDARQLAEKQEDISKKMDEAANQPKALSDSGKTEELAKDLAQQKQGVTNLLNQMKRVSDQSENAEPLLSKQLYDSLRRNSQGNLDQSLTAAEEWTKRNFLNNAQPFEQRASKDIQNLKQDVERAAESVLGDETESLRMAKRELDALADQLQREVSRAMATNQFASNALTAAARGMKTNLATQGVSTNRMAGLGTRTNSSDLARLGTNGPPRAGQGTNASGQQVASTAGQNSDRDPKAQQGQGNQNSDQQAQAGNAQNTPNATQGQQPGQQTASTQNQNGNQGQPQEGQQGQRGQGQQGEQGQQGRQGQQPGQQGQQAQNGQQGQQGQKGQQAQQQQQAQRGQGQGQGQGQPNDQQANAQNPGEAQQPSDRPNDNPQRGQRGTRPNQFANLFNQPGAGPRDRDRADSESSPLTGDEYGDWSQRLSNVEEMVDRPELRNRIAQARDRARAARTEFKRYAKPPRWDLVNADILKPLLEVRQRIADELSRRETNESLAPIDRDPVPNKYSDLVKRYYEKLGNGQ